jgi:hypothetical protein
MHPKAQALWLTARHRSYTSELYRAARLSNNINTVAFGNSRRLVRRARNVAVGRGRGRARVLASSVSSSRQVRGSLNGRWS